jgi:hypothetical protein
MGKRMKSSPAKRFASGADAVHRFDNFHPGTARMLAIVSLGILRPDFFREVAAILAAALDGPPDMAAVSTVMRRHGLTPA